MRLSLERIIIDNFKGVRRLALDFGKAQTNIFGMNGSGKSTIPDAFCWVMFNKDSHGNAPGSDNFREKPLDENGAEIHNLDTTVELVCTLDGKAFNLKRTQRENWVKKRGSVNPVFQGNASTYWINDVETALKDFKARIAEIAPEEVFRLIGTLAAFNAQEWKKRREQLLTLSGSDVDGQLLSTDEYRPIADECGQRNIGIDDLRKVLADHRKRTNTELQMIPVRIDEARKALPTFAKAEIEDAEWIVKDTSETIERINTMIAEEKASAGTASVTAQIVALEQELTSITRRITDEWTDGKRKLERRRDEASEHMSSAMKDIDFTNRRIDMLKGQLSDALLARDELRKSYGTIKSEQFVFSDTDMICPVCERPMPYEKIVDAKNTALERFTSEKKAKLDDICKRGAEKSKEADALTEELKSLDAHIKKIQETEQAAKAEREAVSAEITAYPESPDYDGNPRIVGLRDQIAELQAKKAKSPEEKVAELLMRRAELQAQLESKRAILARRDAGIETEKRIAQLESEQKEKGAALAELEQLIALAEKFVTDRCAALEESINGCFPTLRWKLFDRQINGGIADVCMCMIPCESGLVAYDSANTAAQINADLEIINVLSKHYDVYVPLFVDGAESVNVLGHTDSQLITLSVSTDKKLTIREVA